MAHCLRSRYRAARKKRAHGGPSRSTNETFPQFIEIVQQLACSFPQGPLSHSHALWVISRRNRLKPKAPSAAPQPPSFVAQA